MAPDWLEPRTIQHWPGKMINELANKVPTSLQYKENSKDVKAWGFLCDLEQEDADILTCFKLHLDPTYPDTRPDAPSPGQARKWFQDYLRCIHDHIEHTFSESFPHWKIQKTEFVFSVPTTWKNPSMIAETERMIKKAGFGADGSNHRAGIGLTEAEAAAVYASKQQFEVSERTAAEDCRLTDHHVANGSSVAKRCGARVRRWWWNHSMEALSGLYKKGSSADHLGDRTSMC